MILRNTRKQAWTHWGPRTFLSEPCHHQLRSKCSTATPARVRFAPSPTGYLHLGGLRTALFNYLIARKTGGQNILRIEDTDQARTVEGAVDHLQGMLKWTGLQFDEGPGVGGNCGPYVQSDRSEIYQEKVQELLKNGHAYRCFCTSERLEKVREMAKKSKRTIGYDRHCLHLQEEDIKKNLESGVPFTVRLKVPEGRTKHVDLVHGEVSFNHRSIDDAIIMKSTGLPTYHLANVVDDHAMGVTHVLRGEEWLSSTPKHLLLYKAFAWEPPSFAHLPLLVNKNGSKLSKRQGDVHIESLKEKGYLPEALLNFVAFLGWGPGTTKEFYTLPELVEDFKLENVNKSATIVSYDKLNHLNKLHIARRLSDPAMREELVSHLTTSIRAELSSRMDEQAKALTMDQEYMIRVVMAIKERIRLLTEAPKFAAPFFVSPDFASDETREWKEKLNMEETAKIVQLLQQKLDVISDWTADAIRTSLNEIAQELNMDFMQVMKNLRYAITGSKVGVDMISIIHLLGKNRTRERVELFASGP
ncbi:putative glutamyl-tRNA synthetase [Phlyctochytrium arcticum]|nr:putative glutamyl-tRNA synthetase [Phlyctochytrium arcticum]